MNANEISICVKEILYKYIESECDKSVNLLGITSVRNIIYILMELEERFGFKVNEQFITDIKDLSIDRLVDLVSIYSSKIVCQHKGCI